MYVTSSKNISNLQKSVKILSHQKKVYVSAEIVSKEEQGQKDQMVGIQNNFCFKLCYTRSIDKSLEW